MLSGCDQGIGKATAKKLVSLGYTVIAGCLKDDNTYKLNQEVINIRAEKCDVTKTEDVMRLVNIVKEEYGGKIHALVNNAGVVSSGHTLFTPIEESENVVSVNLLGTMRMTKMFLPLLVENDGSRIVFMSSVCGLCPLWGVSSYSASKFGIEGYARALRDELHVFGVQVSIINPGSTGTNMIDSYMNSIRDNFERSPASIKMKFGIDYADRCQEYYMKAIPPTIDDVSVPTDYICKAVGSMKPKKRYYSGLLAKTLFRLMAIFPAICSFINRFQAISPHPEMENMW